MGIGLTPDGGWSGIPPDHVERARQLRKESSPPERVLWGKLRGHQLGVKFRRQHQLGRYIADFYSRDASLVVEVDGDTHFTPEAAEYDRQRDAWMTNLGLTVRRFTASEVGTNLDGVLEAIWDESRQHVLRDAPEKQWLRADRLRVGDTLFTNLDQCPTPIVSVERCEVNETVFDLEIEDAHSFVTETGTVHNCGSGTTAYVSEQWGRGWITIDTSRVAMVRTCGPFTVESLSPHRELPQPVPGAEAPTTVVDPGNYLQLILDNLRTTGVKGMSKQERMTFPRLDPFPGRYILDSGEFW